MSSDSDDRQAILQLGQALQRAWNSGDAAGYAALFTEDADYIARNGTHARGRQAIDDGHRPLFAGPLAGSRMRLVGNGSNSQTPETLRFVRSDVAIMIVSGSVLRAEERETGTEHESVQTLVLVKNDSVWQVALFHNTRRDRSPDL